MSSEMLDAHGAKDVGPRQEGHDGESSDAVFNLRLTFEELYVALRALNRFERAKVTRFYQLQAKFGEKADTHYRTDARRARFVIEKIHALTGGVLRFERKDRKHGRPGGPGGTG